MKKILLTFFVTISLCFFTTQAQDVTGVWKGTMVQDSPRRVINFEMALSEKDGKLFGYCYRLFIVEDSLIYNTVRIEARLVDSVLVIEDDKSVSKNFESNTSRVKVAYFFTLPKKGENENAMKGDWTTNRLKRYMAITGTITVQREPNPEVAEVQILKRLAEKKLDREMKFTPRQTASSTAIASPPPVAPDTIQTIAKVTADPQLNTTVNKPTVTTNKPKETKITPPPVIAQATPKPDTVAKQQSQPTVITKVETKPAVAVAKKDLPVVKQKPVPEKPKPVIENKPTVVIASPPVQQPEKPQVQIDKTAGAQINTPSDKPVVATAPPAIVNPTITKRETEIIQTVDLAEDSVVLSLYDNGEIDGDTVSVFINNEQVVAKAGLKATAYKKTVFVKKGQSVQLTLFAENLGSIPPNTGLLVIYSGEQRYQIHFTSTLSKSAVIVLRRQ
jgi:hypothetical protein